MNQSTTEESRLEQVLNSKLKADNISVGPSNANALVVGSLVLSDSAIEYRAWDENQKYMAYQGTPDLETLQSFMFHFGDKKLMQFTGCFNKKGKKVYKGDIIKTSLQFSSYEFMPPYHPTGHDGYGEIDCIGIVVFKDCCFLFYCIEVLKETNVWHDEYNLTKHFVKKYHPLKNVREIIGNVFEDPELLKSVV